MGRSRGRDGIAFEPGQFVSASSFTHLSFLQMRLNPVTEIALNS